MKKVNWVMLAAVAGLTTFVVVAIVHTAQKLLALGELNENLMGRMYNDPNEI